MNMILNVHRTPLFCALLAGTLAVSAVVLQASSFAQTLPSGSGVVLQDVQKKTLPSDLDADNLPEQPEVRDIKVLDEAPVVLDPSVDEAVFVKRIIVDDAGKLDAEAIREIVSPYEGRSLTFKELQEVSRSITQLYKQQGLLTSRVFIPKQEMTDGEVHFSALEGVIGEIDIEVDRWFKARSITHVLPLESGDTLSIDKLKLSLRRLNQNPDRQVGLTLRPGESRGETDVLLKVEDKFPVHLSGTFDNLGRPSIGNFRYGVKLENNNVSGFGDTYLGAVSLTKGSVGVVNRYELPLNSHGTKLAFEHSYSRLRLKTKAGNLRIRGSAYTFSPSVIQEIINTDHVQLSADLAFDFKQQRITGNRRKFSQDDVRVLRSGLTLQQYDSHGRTFARGEVGVGLDLFGASLNGRTTRRDGIQDPASRVGAGSQFIKFSTSVIRMQKLPYDAFGIFKFLGQASPNRLPGLELFQSGGAFTVRGYKEGSIAGDLGAVVSAEVRTPLYFLPKSWKVPLPLTDNTYNLRKSLQFVTFADFGINGYHRPDAGIRNPNDRILGLGVGLRANITRFLSARVDLGFPILAQPGLTNKPRVHFGIESRLF